MLNTSPATRLVTDPEALATTTVYLPASRQLHVSQRQAVARFDFYECANLSSGLFWFQDFSA